MKILKYLSIFLVLISCTTKSETKEVQTPEKTKQYKYLGVTYEEIVRIATSKNNSGKTFFNPEQLFEQNFETVSGRKVTSIATAKQGGMFLTMYGDRDDLETIYIEFPIQNLSESENIFSTKIIDEVIKKILKLDLQLWEIDGVLFKEQKNHVEKLVKSKKVILSSIIPEVIWITISNNKEFTLDMFHKDNYYKIKNK